ncbi:class I SAM-dependent DNA methyltransferase [Mesorhizobium sp. B2-6-2]|uniref:type I restriction-modification system subunit M n=1 Tax=Mesorhizobium sp. B2-6-2 TaxID=2589915 RepID=UPI0011283744|nr:class I SAM-dependent DNA methyltransferase [Mesorhizobium sp. B2-6-2]TPJ72452.1 SAM-dependent DNA methyltransferase [Mesorhizobium sp. B2-6-2]
MAIDLAEIEKRLWSVADQLRANSGLKPSEYSRPVLGLLFLRYAESRFAAVEKELRPREGSRLGPPGPDAYKARNVIYLSPEARFSHLLQLPDGSNLGRALNHAMEDIEKHNPDLADALPKNYGAVGDGILRELIKLLAPVEIEGDAFGKVYEYFMGSFALQEMQKGGEYYTPSSIVRLIVEIIEPYRGRILDPACGSGGMFVHSADFVRAHQASPEKELSIYGIEKVSETLRLAKMNLAVHGLGGTIKDANAYYDEPFSDLDGVVGKFDFVMANPPFNVTGVDKDKESVAKRADRFPFGLPRADNGNYLWIELFWSALNEAGRAGFVMANSAADARGSEAEVRQRLIESGGVDVIVSVGPNFFYTVTLPCTLWFLDKGKRAGNRADEVLFIDARHTFRQIDRAHRDFTDAQVEFLANIVRLWRGEEIEANWGSDELLATSGLSDGYADVPGLCKVAKRSDIEAQGWSLNPGRYVGVKAGEVEDVDFASRLENLQEEFERLTAEARDWETTIASNGARIVQGAWDIVK